jgi:uncharacterized protein (DUF2384 family)
MDARAEVIDREQCLRLLAADEIGRLAVVARVRHLAADLWAVGDKAHWMRLVPDRVTGRRVRRSADP